MMLEQICREIYETTSYEALTKAEQERLIVLMVHDLAMAAQSADLPFVRTLVDDELLVGASTGDQTPSSAMTEKVITDGVPAYSLWGRADKSRSFDMAVQHNAMAVTASIREDFVTGTHPGAVIFPLVIAAAERRGLSTEALFGAAAVGLKISMFLLDRFGKAITAAGYRPTTAINTIAGAAALAKAQGQSADEALRAMSAAAGMMQGYAFHFQEGTEEWLVQVPLVASAAVLACKNAGALHFSHSQFLTGDKSLGSILGVSFEDSEGDHRSSLTDRSRPDLVSSKSGELASANLVSSTPASGNLASLNLALTRLGVKRHPVNSFVQPVVEATLCLMRGMPENILGTNEIDDILVTVPQAFEAVSATLLNAGRLTSPNLGILSLPISVALTLMQGRLNFMDFRKANGEEVLAMAKRIRVEFSRELRDYDVKVQLAVAGVTYDGSCPTSFFYPSPEEELTWVTEQTPGQPLPWVSRLVGFVRS